jgi:hypothetical protein
VAIHEESPKNPDHNDDAQDDDNDNAQDSAHDGNTNDDLEEGKILVEGKIMEDDKGNKDKGNKQFKV